jgi:hypothetical protein
VDSGILTETVSGKIEIRDATQADILAFHGAPHGKTMRAIAAVRVTPDGTRTLGLAGIYYSGTVAILSQVVAFLHLVEDFTDEPEIMGAILTAALRFRRMLRKINAPVFAIRDPDLPSSEKLFRVFGFTLAMVDPIEGEIWQWTDAPYRREREGDAC